MNFLRLMRTKIRIVSGDVGGKGCLNDDIAGVVMLEMGFL